MLNKNLMNSLEREVKQKDTKPKAKSDKSVEQIIIDRLLEAINSEDGTLPWLKPWYVPCMNWYTQKEYRGINTTLLQGGSGEYITFKQLKEYNEKNKVDYRIKKEHKSYIIVFSNRKEIKITEEKAKELISKGFGNYIFQDKTTGQYIRISVTYRYYTVFDIKEIVDKDGNTLPSHIETGKINIRFKDADEVIERYINESGVRIKDHSEDRAFYREFGDTVCIPEMTYFKVPQAYYRVLFHELIHSTGIKSRLARPCFEDYHTSRQVRSKEELVAEVGAMFLCGVTGLREDDKASFWDYNSESYIVSWSKYIKEHPKEVLSAFSMAERAKSYILGNLNADDDSTEIKIQQ